MRYLPLKLSVLREHGRRGHVTQIEFVSHNDPHDRSIAEAALVEWRLVNNLVQKKREVQNRSDSGIDMYAWMCVNI